jgi:hypothetical protein
VIELLQFIFSDKGRDAHRAASFLLLLFIAWKVIDQDKRLAVMESQLVTRQAVTGPGPVTPAASLSQANHQR